MKSLKSYVSKSSKLLNLLRLYGDPESLKILTESRLVLQNMASALAGDLDGKKSKCIISEAETTSWSLMSNFTELPKNLRAALEQLSSDEDVRSLQAYITELLETCSPDAEDEEAPSFDFDALPPIDWEEGVETWKKNTEADLWTFLGLSAARKIPLFNEFADPDSNLDPWDSRHAGLFKTGEGLIPLRPRWHQLVGVMKMLSDMFEGKTVLLMDEVGLGKTLQAVALICMVEFFRNYYKAHHTFPGEFGKHFDLDVLDKPLMLAIRCPQAGRQFQGSSGNIPQLPHILVVPPNLQAQMLSELHRYLVPHSFDILPYSSLWEREPRAHFWNNIYKSCRHPAERRIVVATHKVRLLHIHIVLYHSVFRHQAVQSDGGRVFPGVTGVPIFPKDGFPQTNSVFAMRWLIVVVDEAHICLNANTFFTAASGLRKVSTHLVAMTATPITTKPKVQNLPILTFNPFTDKNIGLVDARPILGTTGIAIRQQGEAYAEGAQCCRAPRPEGSP